MVPPCKRCRTKGISCYIQSGGSACVNCAKNKQRCSAGVARKPTTEKKGTAVKANRPELPKPKAIERPPTSRQDDPDVQILSSPSSSHFLRDTVQPEVAPRTRSQMADVKVQLRKEERRYTAEEKGKGKFFFSSHTILNNYWLGRALPDENQLRDLQEELRQSKTLLDAILPGYFRLTETVHRLEDEVRDLRGGETVRRLEDEVRTLRDEHARVKRQADQAERIADIANDRFHELFDVVEALRIRLDTALASDDESEDPTVGAERQFDNANSLADYIADRLDDPAAREVVEKQQADDSLAVTPLPAATDNLQSSNKQPPQPPSDSPQPRPPSDMPPPPPPSLPPSQAPVVTVEALTPQTSQENEAANLTTRLEVPTSPNIEGTSTEARRSRSRSVSTANGSPRRSPRNLSRSRSPSPFALPAKRNADVIAEEPARKKARGT